MEGIDYLDHEERYAIHESQPDNDQNAVEDEATTNLQVPSLKRKASDIVITSSGKENVPPEDGRQSSDSSFKRPRLTDIKEQLSFLTEDSVIPDSQPWESDDEADEEEYRMTITRTNTTTSTDSNGSKSSVVNRLLRTQLSEDTSSRPLAYQAVAGKSGPGFKIPSLLRRATNLSTTSESSTTSTSNSNEKSVRLGGSKKSNIHYQAYEAERRRHVEAADQKRKSQLKKTVMSTKGRSIMGLLHNNGNGFE
jgi:mediator of replication checkpoint protein 1